jgi:hypothetical protein
MIPAEQLQRFSRECLLLRKALEDANSLPDVDDRILRSNITMLLAALDQKRKSERPSTRADNSKP